MELQIIVVTMIYNAAITQSNMTWYRIQYLEETIDQSLYWQKVPHISAPRASYGLAVVRNLANTDHFIYTQPAKGRAQYKMVKWELPDRCETTTRAICINTRTWYGALV